MEIYYGLTRGAINVTNICTVFLMNNTIITIPSGYSIRDKYFSDPFPGIHKSIFVVINGVGKEYDEYTIVKINTNDNTVTTSVDSVNIVAHTINNNIAFLHSKLKLKYGSFADELPEQKMAVRYLTGNEKVLEIGGNIGRNSLIIAYILGSNPNFVTLEIDSTIAKQLTENRDINGFTFHIENSALSKRKLIQKDWDTKPSDNLEPGFSWVNTISLDDLKQKYNIEFDTLVLYCEGAFYYILMDMPEILNTINLIIMENDYRDMSHKHYIDQVLKKNNFIVDYTESGGWGGCANNFFEVWKRT